MICLSDELIHYGSVVPQDPCSQSTFQEIHTILTQAILTAKLKLSISPDLALNYEATQWPLRNAKLPKSLPMYLIIEYVKIEAPRPVNQTCTVAGCGAGQLCRDCWDLGDFLRHPSRHSWDLTTTAHTMSNVACSRYSRPIRVATLS